MPLQKRRQVQAMLRTARLGLTKPDAPPGRRPIRVLRLSGRFDARELRVERAPPRGCLWITQVLAGGDDGGARLSGSQLDIGMEGPSEALYSDNSMIRI